MSEPVEPAPRPSAPASSRSQAGRNVSVGQILAGVLLVLVVVFIVENTEDVAIRFIVGPKVEVPVYLALLIAAVVGGLITVLLRFRRQHRNR